MNRSSFILAFVCAFTAGCAAVMPRSEVVLRTDPAGAEVRTLTGDLLGNTPLSLTDEMLLKASQNGRLLVLVRAPGHFERQLACDIHAETIHEIRLTPLGQGYFKDRIAQDFSNDINGLARELLVIQGLIGSRKLGEAQQMIEDFQTRYPKIGASYMMAAKLEEMRGNGDRAREMLKRAWSLDNRDPFILKMLETGAKP